METKLHLMGRETKSNLLTGSGPLSSYKKLSEKMEECFEKFYKSAPFNFGVPRTLNNEEVRRQARTLFSQASRPPSVSLPPAPQRPEPTPFTATDLKLDSFMKSVTGVLEKLEKTATTAVRKPEPKRVEEPAAEFDPALGEIRLPETPEPPTNVDQQKNQPVYFSRLIGLCVVGLVFFSVKTFFRHQSIDEKTLLPYNHVGGPVVHDGKIYLADWFRSNLYVHKAEKGLPLLAAENIPDPLITGLAMTDENLWTIDGVNNRIQKHALTPEHLVLRTFPAPGKKPRGLFFDGTNLWSGDEALNVIYRHHGTDVAAVEDEFSFSGPAMTSFQILDGNVWILDKNARKIFQYKLQKPLLLTGSMDLAPVLNGAEPRGFYIDKEKIFLATENPSALVKILR